MSPQARRLAALALSLIAGGIASRGRADTLTTATDPLGACIDGALAGLVARPVAGVFLDAPASRSLPIHLEATGCIGFLGIGPERVRGLDLGLYTPSGTLLVADAPRDGHPYLRFCGAAGVDLILVVHVRTGRGEVRVMRIEDAPPALVDLETRLDACAMPISGLPSTPPELSPPLPERPLTEQLGEAGAPDRALGREPLGPPLTATLAEHASVRRPLELGAAGCYVVVGLGEGAIHALGLGLDDPAGRGVAATLVRERAARLEFCVPAPGRCALRVHATSGHGEVGAQLFRVREPEVERPAGLEGGARVRYAEVAAVLARRDLPARPLGWVQLEPGEELRVPVRVGGGACVGIAVVLADSPSTGGVELAVEGADQRVLAFGTGQAPAGFLYVCAERDERLRVLARASGTGTTRALLVVGGGAP